MRLAHQGAVYLAAPGSEIRRSLIDTTGPISTNFTSSYPALGLAGGTLAEDVLVRRSGHNGVFIGGAAHIPGDSIRLRRVQILNGVGAGLHAEGGYLYADSGTVTISGNAYPFYGYIDNFARLAKDTLSQLKLMGNTDSLAVIIGRSDRGFRGRMAAGLPDTLWSIKQLRWRVVHNVYIDTLGRFQPRPGSRITFSWGGMIFQRGGRLHARGTGADTIVFQKESPTSGHFNGIALMEAVGTAQDSSYAINTRFSAIESCQWASLGCAALATQGRHVLIVDSSHFRQSTYGAVHLAAPGSRISRTRIDTAGAAGSASYAALALNHRTLAETTTVRRAGGTGVFIGGAAHIPGDSVRLRQVQILNGLGAGLHAEGGYLYADSGTVTISGNAYPFYGYIDNFARLAKDSLSQVNLLGNTDNVAYIIGRGDRPLRGTPGVHTNAAPLTLRAIRQLRMEFRNQTYIDTLARFEPGRGSLITFEWGGLIFRHGGTLSAIGAAGADSIRFRPARTGVQFYGMAFEDPGVSTAAFTPTPPPVATSTLSFVNVDSTSGQSSAFGCCAAIIAATRHRISVSDSRLRRNATGAIRLEAPGSAINRVRVDTTGPTTPYSAVVVNDSVNVTDLTIYRSGQHGFYTLGRGINVLRLHVRQSLGYGLVIAVNNASGSRGLLLRDSTLTGQLSFTADSNAAGGVFVDADSVTLRNCEVRDNGSTTAHHGITSHSNGTITRLVVNNCNLINNAGFGVNNGSLTNAAYLIDATNNWWGDPAGPTGTSGDGVSANVNTTPVCTASCTTTAFGPMGSGMPPAPALPPSDQRSRGILKARRRNRLKR